MLDEVVFRRLVRPTQESCSPREVVLVTDAKSVYDHLTNERGASNADRRVSLELNLLREELQQDNLSIKWVPTTHMLAGVLA